MLMGVTSAKREPVSIFVLLKICGAPSKPISGSSSFACSEESCSKERLAGNWKFTELSGGKSHSLKFVMFLGFGSAEYVTVCWSFWWVSTKFPCRVKFSLWRFWIAGKVSAVLGDTAKGGELIGSPVKVLVVLREMGSDLGMIVSSADRLVVCLEGTAIVGRTLDSAVMFLAPLGDTVVVWGTVDSPVMFLGVLGDTAIVGGTTDSSLMFLSVLGDTALVWEMTGSPQKFLSVLGDTAIVWGMTTDSVGDTDGKMHSTGMGLSSCTWNSGKVKLLFIAVNLNCYSHCCK